MTSKCTVEAFRGRCLWDIPHQGLEQKASIMGDLTLDKGSRFRVLLTNLTPKP